MPMVYNFIKFLITTIYSVSQESPLQIEHNKVKNVLSILNNELYILTKFISKTLILKTTDMFSREQYNII